MSTTMHRIEGRDVPTVSDAGTASRVTGVVAVLLAATGVVVAVVGASDRGRGIAWAAVVLVAAFALSTFVIAVARPREPMWIWLVGGTIAGALALQTDRAFGLVPLLAAAVGIALPDGWVGTSAARIALAFVTAIGIPCAVIAGLSDSPPRPLLTAESLAVGVVAIVGYGIRCRSAAAAERARLQWARWGGVVAGARALVV